MRLDRNLAAINGAELDFDLFRAVADGESVWVFNEGAARRVTIDEKRQIQVIANPDE